MNASFYLVFSSFWGLVTFSFPARPVSALDGLHSIGFCYFLSPFRMGLASPGRALGRSSLLTISLELLALSGIPLFSTNLFRLASLLALLVGLNLSFLMGALVWFFKITKAAPFESVEVFCRDPFLALYFSLSSLMIFRLLCLLPSAALFALAIWPFGPPPPRFPLWWGPHKELCFDWSAGLSAGIFRSVRANVGPFFFSVDPHQADLQQGLLLLCSRLHFNSTPTILGVTFDRTLSISKHVSSLRTGFFPRLTVLRCVSAFSWSPSKESLSLLYKSFLRLLLIYASPGWFPLLSATNFTKLERLHRAASRAITDCLSSSPIPLLLTEASLPPLRVILTHFTLLSYEQALCLPTSFPISGLARLGVKPRLCRSSWIAFASTHPLMLPSASSREALLACPLFLLRIFLRSPWSPPFPPHALALIPLSLAKVWLSLTLTLSPVMIWYSGQTALFLFLLARAAPAFLPTALSVALRPLFPFRQAKCVHVFLLKSAPVCTLFCRSRRHQRVCHFPSLLFLSDSRSVLTTLSSPPSFLLSQTLWQIWQELSSLSSCSIRLQWVPGDWFLPGNNTADELARLGALLAPSPISCSLSPLISRIHSGNQQQHDRDWGIEAMPPFLATFRYCSLDTIFGEAAAVA